MLMSPKIGCGGWIVSDDIPMTFSIVSTITPIVILLQAKDEDIFTARLRCFREEC